MAGLWRKYEIKSPGQNAASRKTLITFAAASFILLSLGGWLTSLGMGSWYDALQKPWFQPPGWAFAPAWTTILTLLAMLMAKNGVTEGAVNTPVLAYPPPKPGMYK